MNERKTIFEISHVKQKPSTIIEELEKSLDTKVDDDRTQTIGTEMWVIEDAICLLKYLDQDEYYALDVD